MRGAVAWVVPVACWLVIVAPSLSSADGAGPAGAQQVELVVTSEVYGAVAPIENGRPCLGPARCSCPEGGAAARHAAIEQARANSTAGTVLVLDTGSCVPRPPAPVPVGTSRVSAALIVSRPWARL